MITVAFYFIIKTVCKTEKPLYNFQSYDTILLWISQLHSMFTITSQILKQYVFYLYGGRNSLTQNFQTGHGRTKYTVRQLYNATDLILTKIEVPSMMQCMPSMCPNFICNLTTRQRPTLSMTGNMASCCAGSERTWSQ